MVEAPPDLQPESPRVPLPPPIIPETEDSTPSPVSETSSGYISTSISTATLSDVYTLSWDLPLPPPSSRRTDGGEGTADAGGEGLATERPPLALQPSQAPQSLLVWDHAAEEKTEPDGGPSLRTGEGPPRTDPEPDSKAEPESLSAQEDETDPTEKQPSAQTQELHPPSESAPESSPGRDQIPEDPPVSVPSSRGEQVGLNENEAVTEADPQVPDSGFTPNHDAPAAPAPVQSDVQNSKANPTGTGPFKIQKVKSSDLKSFQPILGADEAANERADRGGGSSSSLAAPPESLEIISDSEGDAAAALPDWLKEGELVTVGGNKSGTVRYVGPTDFAEGTWVGVELEAPAGE